MTPDLVIFDCDGVLVDTEGATSAVIADNLKRYGLSLDATEVDSLFTGGTMNDVEIQARRRGAALPDLWLTEIYDAIFARLGQGVDVLDGVTDLLDALDAADVPSVIASNGPMQKMRVSLGPSGLWERFGGDRDGRILCREHHAPKPDPAMVLHAMQIAGADPTKTVMIDDSPTGCRAALNAGIRCVGLDAYGKTEALAALGIDLVKSMRHAHQLILG